MARCPDNLQNADAPDQALQGFANHLFAGIADNRNGLVPGNYA